MKRVSLISLLLSFCFLGGVQVITADEASQIQYKLIEQWQTDKLLEVPESVLYDPARDILYVSNISGKGRLKNNQGFISKVSLKGEIIILKWITGLNAPKGMAISGDRLFVSDIDLLVEIDMSNGEIVGKYPAPGAKFLNDVAADSSGNIYITDSSKTNSMIYKMSEEDITVWIKGGTDIKKPNGLFMEKDRLLVGDSGAKSIKTVDLQSKKTEIFARVGSGIDGLQPDGKGNYFTSNWRGKTSLVTADGKVHVLMDTSASKIYSADLCYIISKNLLLIPTFFDNRVVAYKMK